MNDPSDRRRSVRWPVHLLAKCRWDARDDQKEMDAWVKDVNESGLKLESRDVSEDESVPFHPGRRVTVRGFFYDERGEHPLEAAVRWVHLHPDGKWTAGVQFLNDGKKKTLRLPSFRDFLRVVREEIS